jgi:hypothetical protein
LPLPIWVRTFSVFADDMAYSQGGIQVNNSKIERYRRSAAERALPARFRTPPPTIIYAVTYEALALLLATTPANAFRSLSIS